MKGEGSVKPYTCTRKFPPKHRLNEELDLQSLFGLI
jgi:hypothetical protein